MGDRIAVIDHGKICQVGTPAETYDDPANTFVATFLGTPPMNLVKRDGAILGFRPEHLLPKRAAARRRADGLHLPRPPGRVPGLGAHPLRRARRFSGRSWKSCASCRPMSTCPGCRRASGMPLRCAGANLRYFDQTSGERMVER